MNDLLGWGALLTALVVTLIIAYRHTVTAPAILTAFALRFAAAVANAYFVVLQGKGKDADAFLQQAIALSRAGLVRDFLNVHTGSEFYPWLVSLLYALTAPSALMASGVNVLFGTLLVWNTYRLVLESCGRNGPAIVAAWAIAIFPSMVLFSAIPVREVAVVYPFSLGLIAFGRWLRGSGNLHLAWALVLFLASALLHTGMIAVLPAVGLIVALGWLRAIQIDSKPAWLRMTVAILPFVAVGATVVFLGIGLDKIGGSLANVDVQSVSSVQGRAASARAAYLQGFQPRNVFDLAWQTPIRMVYFEFAPFPWMVRTLSDVVGLLDAGVYVLLVGALVRRRAVVARDAELRAYLLILFLCVGVFSVGTSNYGTALRHRAKFAPLLIALVSLAYSRPRNTTVLRYAPAESRSPN